MLQYRSMISSLMYLTSSRPDIMFAVCACARFQVTPKVSHLHAMKRIFRYLKGQPKLGLWYPKDSPFDLEAYTDSDYAGASLDRKSTTGGCQFLGSRVISWQCKKQTVVANSTTEAEYVAASSSCCGQIAYSDVTRFTTYQYVADFTHKAFDIGRFQYLIATLEEITKEETEERTLSSSTQWFSDLSLMWDANEEHVPIHSNDPLLSEITKLKERVKKLKEENKSRTSGLKGVFDEQEVKVEKVVSTAEVTTASATPITVDELTLAQTLIEIKAAKPKAVTTTATTTTTVVTRHKAIRVVVQEPKPEKPLKKKDQILIDEEIAQKLQAQLNVKLEEEEKLAKQKEEDANIVEWDNVQAMIDADYEPAARLQATKDKKLISIDSEVVKGDKEKDEGSVTRAEESSSKIVGTELEQERIKKQKIDDDQEEAEMKRHMEIVVDEEEIAVDAIPLATKPPIIVD
ncbi:hypothetical protein Tco_1004702 [Tanacetum coccineum]|uniref:Uncharacterized protein n=1 Tax=Tanacetum coccineum TaxID=301880 RepID=A0ABQ5FDC3_9ASTR